jgi:hypothetical protein
VWKAKNIPHNCLKNISLGFPIKFNKAVTASVQQGNRMGQTLLARTADTEYNMNRERKTKKGEWRKENYREKNNGSRESVKDVTKNKIVLLFDKERKNKLYRKKKSIPFIDYCEDI